MTSRPKVWCCSAALQGAPASRESIGNNGNCRRRLAAITKLASATNPAFGFGLGNGVSAAPLMAALVKSTFAHPASHFRVASSWTMSISLTVLKRAVRSSSGISRKSHEPRMTTRLASGHSRRPCGSSLGSGSVERLKLYGAVMAGGSVDCLADIAHFLDPRRGRGLKMSPPFELHVQLPADYFSRFGGDGLQRPDTAGL